MHEDIMTVLTSPSTVRIRILPAVPAAVGAGPRYNELTVDQSASGRVPCMRACPAGAHDR